MLQGNTGTWRPEARVVSTATSGLHDNSGYLRLAITVIETAAADIRTASDLLEVDPECPHHNGALNRGRVAWAWIHDDTVALPRVGRLRFRELCDALGWDVSFFRERLVRQLTNWAAMRLSQPEFQLSKAERLRRVGISKAMTERAKALKESGS